MNRNIDAAPDVAADRGTVLVVDDDEMIVALLTDVLKLAGYRVHTASGSAALGIAHDRQPDLILLDLMMPEMDGGEVSRRLRSDPVTEGIPIVVMSAHDTTGAIAATLPVDDMLRKPFTVKQLYATVSRWIEARDE